MHNPLVIPGQLQVAAGEEGINLGQNSRNYPLLSREFSQDELADIELVKDALMVLPFTHSSRRSFAGDIVPLNQQQAGDERPTGNTLPIDESLGLDECVFMQWGAVEKSGGYGRYHMLIDPEFVLNDPRCFVTPRDITQATFHDDSRYDELPPETRKKVVDGYLSKILPGKDWLELIARQAYLKTRTSEPIIIVDPKEFGEIKFFGTVPQSAVSEVIGPEDEHRIWRELFLNGFVVGPVHRSKHRATGYDVTPQELGLSGSEAEDFWGTLYQRES